MESEFFIASTAIIFSLGVLPGSILYFIHRVAAKKLDTVVRVVETESPPGFLRYSDSTESALQGALLLKPVFCRLRSE